MQKTSPFGGSWQGSLRDLANVVYHIKRLRISGRLLLRNTERLSVAHLYFRSGHLAHIVGNRGDARSILLELRQWTRAFIRFDRNVPMEMVMLGEEYGQLLEEVLKYLHQCGLVVMPRALRIVDGDIVASPEVRQLITPQEWQV